MPRWAVISLCALAAVAVAAILLEGVVIFTMITRLNHTQMQVCRLYAIQHLVTLPACRR